MVHTDSTDSTDLTTAIPDLTTRLRRQNETAALGDAIAELSARIQAATYELLAMIHQFDERSGWGAGFASCAHWLNWRTGLAMGAAREKVRIAVPRAQAPEPTRFANRGNAAPSYVTGRVGQTAGGTGNIAGQRVLQHVVPSPFFTRPLRSPRCLQNTFAHESFMDEVAASMQADPVEYRVRHLADTRLREVVTEAARAASWEARPSPRTDNPRAGVVSGRGIACVLYEGNNGYVALVAEVDVDQGTGDLAVKRFVVALDVGPISSPDGVRNQIEGGVLQGLSRAVGEEVTWDSEKVTSVDWATYTSLFLPAWDHPRYGVGSQIPAIETVLINRPDAEAMGAGETAITLVAAAVGNAIFDATGGAPP